MYTFRRIIFGVVLFIAVVNAGRHDDDYDPDMEKEHYLDLLDKAKIVMDAAGDKQWEKMKVRSESLLKLVIALNNLRMATVDLTLLLLDSNECVKELSQFKDVKDMQNIYHLSFNVTFVPDASLKGGSDHVQQVVQNIERINESAMKTLRNTMNSLEKSYDEMFANVLEKKDLQENVKIPEDHLEEYLEKFNTTIEKIDDKVDQTIARTEDEIRESKRIYHKTDTEVTNVMHDLAFSSKFECSVVRINEGYEALECLNDNDMRDLFQALSKMKVEISEYYEAQKNSLTPEVIQTLNSLIDRIKGIIEKIRKFFEWQKQHEDELFRQMKEGIAKGQIDKFNETAFRITRNIQQAEEYINEIWKTTNNNYEETLKKAKSFTNFETAIRAIQTVEIRALLDGKGGNLERLKKNLLDYTREQFKLSYNGQSYHKDVFRYAYDIYTLQDYYASFFLYDMLNKFEKKEFLAGRKSFIHDVKLFLELNLQLILRSNCNSSLILLLGRPSEIKRYIRKSLVYIDLVEMIYSKSKPVKRRMGVLKEFLYYYVQNTIWMESLPSCKAMKDLQKYRYQPQK